MGNGCWLSASRTKRIVKAGVSLAVEIVRSCSGVSRINS